jgi:hypothetical protein
LSFAGNQLDHGNAFERKCDGTLDGKINSVELSKKSYEISNSDLEKRFPHLLLSSSIEDFSNTAKKKSSKVLEDLRHLEVKAIDNREIYPNKLTKKMSYIWDDLKNLAARSQNTFSDSPSSFSTQRLDVTGIQMLTEGCKTYIVEPKINIDDNSNSILKTVTYKSSNSNNHNDEANQGELKFGVWTKVKPHKRSDGGRRSSDRALKIIQENSAILQKILTCQARKRLPDLEEISKDITISPINEEISKIFSPILEKMGLNEDEINEKLSKINLKELDTKKINTSAFDEKINDELLKISFIGDNDDFAYIPDIDDISSDYLEARDTFIDRQINEELSKLITNYKEISPTTLKNKTKDLNASSDISTSTHKYSYKTSNDAIDIERKYSFKYPVNSLMCSENPLAYTIRDTSLLQNDGLNTSDIRIYSQLEKTNQVTCIQNLPITNTKTNNQDFIPSNISYISDILNSPKIDCPSSVMEKQSNDYISPLENSYHNTSTSSVLQNSTYDSKSRILPKKCSNNQYSIQGYDSKNNIGCDGFENSTFELTSRKVALLSTLNHEYEKKHCRLLKENIEFHTNYDCSKELSTMKKSTTQNIDLKLRPLQIDSTEVDNGAQCYSNTQVINSTMKHKSKNDNRLSLISTIETNNYRSNYQFKNYDNMSPIQNYSAYSENDDVLRQPYNNKTLQSESEVPSYLTDTPITTTNQHQDMQVSSPHHRFSNYKKVINSSYTTVPTCIENSLTKMSTTVATIIPPTSQNMYDDNFIDRSYNNSTLTLANLDESKKL